VPPTRVPRGRRAATRSDRVTPVVEAVLPRPRLAAGRLLRGVFAAALAVVVALTMTGQAHADPNVAEVEAQIDALWEEAEPLIEQYNAVHEDFERNTAKQTELKAALAPLEEELAGAQEVIGAIAAQAYMGGQTNLINSVMSAKTPSQIADQISYLEALGRSRTTQLQEVLELKAQYDAAMVPIVALGERLQAQDAELSARRAEIEQRLGELQVLRAKVGSVDTTSTKPAVCPAEYLPTPGYKAAAFACSQIGKSYVWGSAGPNTYDCSGLTMRSWEKAGVYLPHNAAAQRRSMRYVDRSDLQIGDLVFIYPAVSHVAIYVGGGWVVHAPRSGDVVRMKQLSKVTQIHSFGRPG
jgi:cell wall-associated NlpC family hydrolase